MNLNLFIFREFSGDYEVHNDVLVVKYGKLDTALYKKHHLEDRYEIKVELVGGVNAKNIIGNTRIEIKLNDIEKLPEWGYRS